MAAPAPMNDHRDHDRPFSADSSKNVPGRLSASLRYADSGVSASASTLRVTGTTRCSAARSRKCSREVVAAARLACTESSSQIGRSPSARHWRSVTAMKTGDTVADFELPDQTGTPRRLSALLSDGPVVLFFYPAAMTPGCTKEACHFRDLAQEFTAVGANRVGISVDPVAKQAKFADAQRFDYPLLSDTDGAVANHFGVKRGLLGKLLPVKRTTFVIDTDRTGARRHLQRVEHGLPRGQGVADAACSQLAAGQVIAPAMARAVPSSPRPSRADCRGCLARLHIPRRAATPLFGRPRHLRRPWSHSRHATTR